MSGYGSTSFGGSNSVRLRQATLPVLNWTECSRYLPDVQLTADMICTYEPGKDACQVQPIVALSWKKASDKALLNQKLLFKE